MEDNINGFPGYHITREGLLYSRYDKVGKLTKVYHKNKSYIRSNGYQQIVLKIRKLGLIRRAYIHRLVAEAYIPNPDGKLEVNHIDGNKENNHYSNLEWATRKENVVHSFEVLGKEVASGKTHILSKAIVAIDDEGNIVEDFESAGQAQKSGKGYTTSNIARSIKNGTKHKGLLWKHK